MTNQEYEKHLKSKTVDQLKEHYEKIFMVRPPSRYRKGDIIAELCEKFKELNAINPHADDVNPELEEPTPVKTPSKFSRNNNGQPSRRSLIITLTQENIWDTDTLSEWLYLMNPEWPKDKNRAAISGTLTDMKRNHGWVVKPDNKGRIIVC